MGWDSYGSKVAVICPSRWYPLGSQQWASLAHVELLGPGPGS